jgi:hypothetical protein
MLNMSRRTLAGTLLVFIVSLLVFRRTGLLRSGVAAARRGVMDYSLSFSHFDAAFSLRESRRACSGLNSAHSRWVCCFFLIWIWQQNPLPSLSHKNNST